MLCRLLPPTNLLVRKWTSSVQSVRTKKKWVTAESSALKNDPTHLALSYFDQHYGSQFPQNWPLIRLALLSLQKYGALVNTFCHGYEAIERLANLGAEEFVQHAARDLQKSFSEKNWQNKIKTGDLDAHTTGEYLQKSSEENGISDYEKTFVSQQNTEEKSDHFVEDSWRDQYIVAAGFESKLEYMIGQENSPDDPANMIDISAPVDSVQFPITISPFLKCFIFPHGNFQQLPPSRLESSSGLLYYYTMDASSLLPVMALDIQPNESVLDMCAAPGGKALALLSVLTEGGIVLNEPATARRKRLLSVLDSYVPKEFINSGKVQVTAVEGQKWGVTSKNTFDKILVDVPCTTDRHSLKERDNNIFKPRRSQERWNLPSLQEELLCSALLSVRPGGDVVYSTCSLSTLQNDGVVQGAITKCQEEFDLQIQVVDLSPLATCLSSVFKFSDITKYGQLVIPDLTANFGPMYFARLHKKA
ncbi:5-methylcytosine rRNA methyltransferase NSUN4 [Holothuria leucospilota]|uniref:NOL1/NOP2/Sun domain family member 4 n=1 Tax=Holothuria leucospilota TaxID=206669 RepID=A0A9Q1BIZ0_HOLLE|nr:5-methylcytosine rRNA methyltransferase NSUN4 [Holothuria leucospilota]